MQIFLMYALIGLAGQAVGGSLGMGYGITTTSLLLATGATPAVASASVHLAQVGTSLASGLSHWKFRNIDWRVVSLIAGPGAVGAIIGAFALSTVSTEFAEPWMAAVLILLGLYVVIRFSFLNVTSRLTKPRPGMRFLGPLGLVAGFVDSTGGGGWGPVATTTLLSSGRLEPRKVVGSVGTAEFVVTLAASLAFLVALGSSDLSWVIVVGMLVGGAIIAPFAAWLVRLMPARILGVAAGGLIVLTNIRALLNALEFSTSTLLAAYVVIMIGWVAALTMAIRSLRVERAQQAAKEAEPASALSHG